MAWNFSEPAPAPEAVASAAPTLAPSIVATNTITAHSSQTHQGCGSSFLSPRSPSAPGRSTFPATSPTMITRLRANAPIVATSSPLTAMVPVSAPGLASARPHTPSATPTITGLAAPTNITLDQSIEHKREEVAKAKAKTPLPDLELLVAQEEPPRNFFRAVRPENPNKTTIIAEIKRMSPSAGLIRPEYAGDSVGVGEEVGVG